MPALKRASEAPAAANKKRAKKNDGECVLLAHEKKDADESVGSYENIDQNQPSFQEWTRFLAEICLHPREYRCSYSQLSELNKAKPCMLGIDEAGRGPVLGPMIYACAVAPIASLEHLRGFGLADSKVLTEEQRESILDKMLNVHEQCAYGIHSISPVYITEKMLDVNKTSLNVISHDAAIALIQRALDDGVNLQKVYVDTVGKADKYQAKLKGLFPTLDICVESKADATYPIVSAASIFAKVTRDRALANWPRSELGNVPQDTCIGSGYPGDPVTKEYLRKCLDPVGGFPGVVRASWATAITLIEKHCSKIVWPDEETAVVKKKRGSKKQTNACDNDDEDEDTSLTEKENNRQNLASSLVSFFTAKQPATAEQKLARRRQRFFRDRSLVHVTDF